MTSWWARWLLKSPTLRLFTPPVIQAQITWKLRVTAFCAGKSPATGDFPAQRAVTWKMFPFDDVIMQAGDNDDDIDERDGDDQRYKLWVMSTVFLAVFVSILTCISSEFRFTNKFAGCVIYSPTYFCFISLPPRLSPLLVAYTWSVWVNVPEQIKTSKQE